MKILHTSDLHIGLKLMNYDLKEDQADTFIKSAWPRSKKNRTLF